MNRILAITVYFLFVMAAIFFEPSSSNAAAANTEILHKDKQLEIIRKDFLQLDTITASHVFAAFDYILAKNKAQPPLISYAVAKKVVELTRANFFRFNDTLSQDGFLSLVMGIIQTESGFNPMAISNKNARGLMQIHIPTWGKYITEHNAHNIGNNISMGIDILYNYYVKSDRDLSRTLGKYYGAQDKIYINTVLRNAIKFKRHYISKRNAFLRAFAAHTLDIKEKEGEKS